MPDLSDGIGFENEIDPKEEGKGLVNGLGWTMLGASSIPVLKALNQSCRFLLSATNTPGSQLDFLRVFDIPSRTTGWRR